MVEVAEPDPEPTAYRPVVTADRRRAMLESTVLPGPERARDVERRVRPWLEDELKAAGLEWGAPVYMRAFKEEAEMELWMQEPGGGRFRLFRNYAIHAWSGNLGPKLKEGDGQSPEGFYEVRRGWAGDAGTSFPRSEVREGCPGQVVGPGDGVALRGVCLRDDGRPEDGRAALGDAGDPLPP